MFNLHSIACGFDDAALALGNCRIDQLQPDCLKPGEGAGLVGFHEAAIADDIAGRIAASRRSTLWSCIYGGPALHVANLR